MNQNFDYIVDLFRNLGRLGNGNDLSNFTCSIAQTVPAIGRDIYEFFGFPVPDNEPRVYREYPVGDGCRVDLAFEANQHMFLLENKIWDRNYHFKQYSEASRVIKNKDVSLGLISNHRLDGTDAALSRQYKWTVKYWEELVDYLSKRYGESDPLVTGYIAYVKEVCSMLPIGKIQIDDSTLVSLYHFNNLVKKLIESSSHDHFTYKIYPSTHPSFGLSWPGHYYRLENALPETKKDIYPFFGIRYIPTPTIYICVEHGWNKPLFEALMSIIDVQDEVCQIREINKSEIDFDLIPECYQAFKQADKDEQERLWKSFFEHVNKKFFEGHLK